MDRIPLYARGGAVIPMWPVAPDRADGYQPRSTELHVVVPGRRRHVQLAAGRGRRRHHRCRARGLPAYGLHSEPGRPHGDAAGPHQRDGYPEFVREEFVLIIRGAHPCEVRIDGVDHRVTDGRVRFDNNGGNFDALFNV
jgi:alpha-glucosidase